MERFCENCRLCLVRKKTTAGTVAYQKLQRNYIMKQQKEQIKIVNVMADGRIVENMSTIVIPSWHPYYAVQDYFTRKDIA